MTVQDRRLELQAVLEALLTGVDGVDDPSNHVYFQPPASAVMTYPCVVYERDNTSLRSADNLPYNWQQRYQVTLIDRNPDSEVVDKLNALPLSRFNRHFATSGLNHDVFVIYH